jgi:hypothetical protein
MSKPLSNNGNRIRHDHSQYKHENESERPILKIFGVTNQQVGEVLRKLQRSEEQKPIDQAEFEQTLFRCPEKYADE